MEIRAQTLQAAQEDHEHWRTRSLRMVLIVVAAVGLPAFGSLILDAVARGRVTPLLIVYALTYGGLVALAFARALGVKVRAWLFFGLAYVLASASFARVGLAGSGRLYLVFIPAVATILLTSRSGLVCMGISIAVYGVFAALASLGALSPWVTEKGNPLDLGFWLEAGAALLVFLVTLTALLTRLVRRHIQTLALSSRMTEELERAYRTLEQQVRDRTRELGLLNSVAALASGQVDLGEVLRVSLERTMSAFGYEAGGAYGLNETTGRLVMLAYKGISESFARQMENLPMESALAGKELNLEQPLTWSVEGYPPGELRGHIEAEGLRCLIGVPLAARGRLVGGMVLTSRVDRRVTAEEGSLLVAVGQQIGLAVENARLLESERLGREEVNRRRQVAEGLRETLEVLNSNRPVQEALDFIISQACSLMRCDASALMQIDTAAGTLRIRAACGLDLDSVSAVELSLGKGGSRRALAWREPVTVSDVTALMQWEKQEANPEFAEDLSGLELILGQGFRAILSVPMVVHNEIYGGITLYYREPRRFTEEEMQLATSIGSQAALAVENARLRAQAEEAAAMAERNRLARDLHDSVTQAVYSVSLYAEAAARLLRGGKTAEAAEHLRELGSTARDALREMRLLIYGLSPPALESGSLVDAIQRRLDAVESRGGMSVSFQVDGGESLTPRVRQELYQMVTEALNNSLKHSRAQSVRVGLCFGEGEITLSVKDDGVGFVPAQGETSGGRGLRSLRERAHRLSGSVAVESSPGKGTTVTVRVPAR